MRAVTYARYSTERQSATSIEDQARVCHASAVAMGLTVAADYSDAAISGQSKMADRPGGRALLADPFDVLIVEGLDRLSRDSVESEQLVRRFEFRGARVIGVADGYDSASGKSRGLLRMMRGAINETYIDDLREKIHRGISGQLARGYHAGGLSYGYRSVCAGVNHRGESIGHLLEVVPAHADVVREVFARYGEGESCQRIAADLNARLVTGPRGGTWCVSALYGSPAKGSGVLNNELYVGRYVWNRSRWSKNPDTGRRERFMRPPDEWKVEARPELRIVDDGAWRAVRLRMETTREAGGRRGRGGFPTTLFGGLLRCAHCGGAVVAVSRDAYGCAARRDRGATVCIGVRAPRAALDRTLLAHVESVLTSPATLAQIDAAAARILLERSRGSGDTAALAARASALEAEIARIVDGIAAVGVSPALGGRLRAAETALDGVNAARRRASATVLPSAGRAAVRAAMADLASSLRRELPAAREAMRAALGEVIVRPGPGGTYAEFDDAAERLLLAAVGDGMGRVAGVCNRTKLRIR